MDRSIVTLVLVITWVMVLGSCGSSTSATTTTTSTDTTAAATSNLQTVSSGLTPASLDYSANSAATASLSAKSSGSSDPCENASGFLDCQPILLQLYIEIAQDVLDMAVEIVDDVGDEMGALTDGSSGTITVSGYSVEYSKTTDTDYAILMSESGSEVLHVDVEDSVYTLTADVEAISDAEADGLVNVVVNYTDEDTWDIEIFIDAMACDNNDVRAPDKIKLLVDKADGLWTGKAMLYSSLWRVDNSATCSETVTDATTMCQYTDFVGSENAAKANVYMMDRTETSLALIEDLELSDYDDNFDNVFGDTSLFPNSFCNPANTLDAEWGDDCTDEDVDVAAAEFGSEDDWVAPATFVLQEVTMPTSL